MLEDERRDPVHVIDLEMRQKRRQRAVGRNGEDVRIIGVEQRLAKAPAVDLELGNRRRFESLDEQQVAWANAGNGFIDAQLFCGNGLVLLSIRWRRRASASKPAFRCPKW